jgi:hypothetical protein
MNNCLIQKLYDLLFLFSLEFQYRMSIIPKLKFLNLTKKLVYMVKLYLLKCKI